MGLFKELGNSESLFVNELALDYSFVPKLLPYRENETKHIATTIKPLLQKRNGRNLFIHGAPGIGKTVAVKHVFQELEDETDDVVPVYINCWQHNTTFKIFLHMCDELGYKFTQNKKTEDLFTILKGMLNKRSSVLAFDEIDKVEDFDFLYHLIEEIYRKSIILITNYPEWMAELEDRVRSRLLPETLEFKPYSELETRGILKERVSYAFAKDCFDADAFEAIAAKAAELKDIRIGLYLLREAGLAAEDASSRRITLDHSKKAIAKLGEFSVKDKDSLEDEAKAILELVKLNPGKKIGEIYRIYQEQGGKAVYKTFQRKIAKLEQNKFISAEKIAGGAEGKTTILNAGDKKITDF